MSAWGYPSAPSAKITPPWRTATSDCYFWELIGGTSARTSLRKTQVSQLDLPLENHLVKFKGSGRWVAFEAPSRRPQHRWSTVIHTTSTSQPFAIGDPLIIRKMGSISGKPSSHIVINTPIHQGQRYRSTTPLNVLTRPWGPVPCQRPRRWSPRRIKAMPTFPQ